MTPHGFVRAWLPDYESRLAKELEQEFSHLAEDAIVNEFDETHFPEALAAFAAAQRQVCTHECLDLMCTRKERVLNAPVPEPKTK